MTNDFESKGTQKLIAIRVLSDVTTFEVDEMV